MQRNQVGLITVWASLLNRYRGIHADEWKSVRQWVEQHDVQKGQASLRMPCPPPYGFWAPFLRGSWQGSSHFPGDPGRKTEDVFVVLFCRASCEALFSSSFESRRPWNLSFLKWNLVQHFYLPNQSRVNIIFQAEWVGKNSLVREACWETAPLLSWKANLALCFGLWHKQWD